MYSSCSGCVVFGRVSGDSASAYLLQQASSADKATSRLGAVAGHLLETRVRIDPGSSKVNLEFSWAGQGSSTASTSTASSSSSPAPQASEPAPPAAAEEKAEVGSAEKADGGAKSFTAEEVAKHNKKDDVWVIIDDEVLDVTKFLPDHPGGEKAILLYAGRDATEEFNMLHDKKVIPRYAPEAVIGKLRK